ncbi:MAG: hypothetical protein LBM77_12360 [Spirochaetaceae bacterium]|jgi:hypothetical protein|nr:hypothetical protein [Spirochaetaceae bacterium]
MKINFFDKKYISEPSRNNAKYGIIDADNRTKKPAYTTLLHCEEWEAVVINNGTKNIQFVAVDHNIVLLKKQGRLKDDSCDGFLYTVDTNDKLCFVEIKGGDGVKNWANDAFKQLQTTLRHFNMSHKNIDYKEKVAYAANAVHPEFVTFKATRKEKFIDKTGFDLQFCYKIVF